MKRINDEVQFLQLQRFQRYRALISKGQTDWNTYGKSDVQTRLSRLFEEFEIRGILNALNSLFIPFHKECGAHGVKLSVFEPVGTRTEAEQKNAKPIERNGVDRAFPEQSGMERRRSCAPRGNGTLERSGAGQRSGREPDKTCFAGRRTSSGATELSEVTREANGRGACEDEAERRESPVGWAGTN